jgi:predicted HNH restriction endonuclease
MASLIFRKSLANDLPVLFVNIGWTSYYDGTEVVRGNHAHLQKNPGAIVSETSAFVPESDGYFRCGIGIGNINLPNLHIVFVARDPGDNILKAVGIYAGATASAEENNWGIAQTRTAVRIPIVERPSINEWPKGQGMRRWAERGGSHGVEYKKLRDLFDKLAKGLMSSTGAMNMPSTVASGDSGFEGEEKKLWVRHRKRERKFRERKLAETKKANGGRLICEVLDCQFDFYEKYGELGAGFAEVHHKKPLGEAPKRGQVMQLSDLAVVCANCHRMIHRNGQCRPLAHLIRPL